MSLGALAELGLKRAACLEERAKDRQRCGQGGVLLSPTLDKANEPIDTLAEAAKFSGLSRATVAKAKKTYESDNEELKEKVRSGGWRG